MKFPSIKAVTAELKAAKCLTRFKLASEDDYLDVRLQVYPNGDWQVHLGDPQFDTDHRGYWGNGSIDSNTNCRELAVSLIEEARCDYYQSTSAVSGGAQVSYAEPKIGTAEAE